MHLVPFAPIPKHRVHLDPIVAALPASWTTATSRVDAEDIALVASYGSLVLAKRRGFRRIVMAQHGAGQSYGGEFGSSRNPGYPGGDMNDGVGLFLCPNEYSADRWRNRYPTATVKVVGCPRLDTLPHKAPGPLTVAVTWHWNAYFSPEANGALEEYAGALPELAKRWNVIGTGHPQRKDLRWRYEAVGIEYVPDFDDVCRRADVLVFDNTSAGFEFAATGRPVVVVNSRGYRLPAQHGGRFWDWYTIGVNAWSPALLEEAVADALEDSPQLRAERERVLSLVYQPRSGGAALAAAAIQEWAA